MARDLVARAPALAGRRVEVIPNPVDVATLDAAARTARPAALADIAGPYAIYVGKLAFNKGVQHLVPAALAAKLTWPLVVVGDGPDRAALEAAARAAGLDVRFTGWLDRPATLAHVAHAALLVFPVARPRVAEPRAARGRRARRGGGGDGHRRHARRHRAGRDRPAVDVAGRARRGRRPAGRRSGAARRASARRRRPASAPRSRRPPSSRASARSTTRSIAGEASAVADARPLRVAILARSVHPLHGVGGLERHVYDLLHHLARRGLTITLITKPATTPGALGAEGDVSALFAAAVGPDCAAHRAVRDVPRRRTPRHDGDRSRHGLSGLRLARRARRRRRWSARGEVDLVHALGASGLGYALARRRPEGRAPFVFNPQGLEEFGGTHPGFARLKRLAYTPLQAAVRRCAQAADAILATDHALVAPVRTHLAVDPARVHVVPNAVDLETIDRARASAAATAATLRTRLGLAAGERLLLSVGRLEENKGFHVLAAALAELRARAGSGAGWRWVLVGDGPYRPRIAGAIDAAGLTSHVHLAGRVADERAGRVVRRRRRVRAPDAVRRQLARDARGDGARQAGRRDASRRPSRQGAAGRDRLAGRTRRRAGARRSARGIARPSRPTRWRASAQPGGGWSRRRSPGRWWRRSSRRSTPLLLEPDRDHRRA